MRLKKTTNDILCRQGGSPPLTHVVGLREGDDVNAAVADDGADANIAVFGLLEVVHVPVLARNFTSKKKKWVRVCMAIRVVNN